MDSEEVHHPGTTWDAGQFEHSSIPATVKTLFNLSGYLTKRDEWAGSFEELLLDTPRTNTPWHFPPPPRPAQPWRPPRNNSQQLSAQSLETGQLTKDIDEASTPRHCSLLEETCSSPTTVTTKQRRQLQLLSKLTMTPMPDVTAMSFDAATQWLYARK
eukprot:SAG22_NODE_5849_length_944_cov_0.932544_1_plen_157_part_10